MLGFVVNRFYTGRKNSDGVISERKNSWRKNSVPRPSLYCVWIRAHEGENAPLIRMWIDPGMTMFETQATIHEPDLAAARAEMQAAPATKDSA